MPTKSTAPRLKRSQWIRPTREGFAWLALAAVLIIQGYLRGVNLVALIACLLFALFLVNLVWVLVVVRLRRQAVRRRIDGPVFAGEPFDVTFEVNNPLQRSQPGLRLIDQGSHHRFDWFMPMLRPGVQLRRTFTAILPRRGRYYWPALMLRTGYPFGLVQRVLRFDTGDSTIVLPHLGQLHRARLQRWLLEHAQPSASMRRPIRRHSAAQTEFYGLREFRTGDSPRWIHWRTTARVGELMVREFVEPPLDNLTVILEPWTPEPTEDLLARALRPLEGPRDPRPPLALLEKAISLAATICWEWSLMPGSTLGLGLADRKSSALVTESGMRRALGPLERLALVEGVTKPRLAELIAELRKQPLPAGPVVVITTHATELDHALAAGLGRPVVALNVADTLVDEFFEWNVRPAQRPVPAVAAKE
jgi:uncharacterized protein (DUF58 family)